MPSIFLSHNSSDKLFVRKLAHYLSLFGVDAWVDEVEILPGDSLFEKIENGLRSSDYVGAILSQKSIQSEWVNREVRAALTEEFSRRDVVVIPMLIESCSLPLFLADKLYADFTKDFFDGFTRLLRRLLKNDRELLAASDADLKKWIELQKREYSIDTFKAFVVSEAERRQREVELQIEKAEFHQFAQRLRSSSFNVIAEEFERACENGSIFRIAEELNCRTTCTGCGKAHVSAQELIRTVELESGDAIRIEQLKRILCKDERIGVDNECGDCGWWDYVSSPNFGFGD